MTIHNLKTHLSWLLNTKPFLPPAGQHLVLPLPNAPPSSGTLGSQGIAAEVLDPASDTPSNEPPRSQPIVPDVRPLAPSDSEVATTATLTIEDPDSEARPTMAKLRAAPGSTSKPRLISQAYSGRKPLVGSPGSFKEKLSSVSLEPSKRQTESNGTVSRGYLADSREKEHIRSQKALLDDVDMTDIDAIDLTGDSDPRAGSSPSVQVPASASRKRKSGQLGQSTAHGRPRVQDGPSGTLARDAFAPTEDYEDPPPPYSTIAQKSAALPPPLLPILDNNDDNFVSLQNSPSLDADVEDNQRVLESPLKSIPKKRKLLDRVHSGQFDGGSGRVALRKPSRSPKRVDWIDLGRPADEERRSPVKASHRNKWRIIADSEDEDGFELDGRQEVAPFPNVLEKSSGLQSPVKTFGSKSFAIEESKDYRWHECRGNSAPPVRQAGPAEMRLPLPSKTPHASIVLEDPMATPSSCQASPSLLSKGERKAASDFAEWPESCLQAICGELETEVRRLRKAQTDFLEEYDIPSRELVEQSKAVLKRKGVIENLVETRGRFLKANLKKKELAKRVLSFMETEYSHDLTDFHETEAQMKAASEHLRNVEVEMIKLMRTAGFISGEGDSVHLCGQSQASPTKVMVRSTQVATGPHDKGKQWTQEVPDAPPTQRIQQTQVVAKGVVTRTGQDKATLVTSDDPGNALEVVDDCFHGNFEGETFNEPDPGDRDRHDASDTYTMPPRVHAQPSISASGVYFDENDIELDEEALLGMNMGTPPANLIDEDEDEYGDFSLNDEDMLDATGDAQALDANSGQEWKEDNRHIFQETSGNCARQQLGRDTLKRNPSTRASASMGPPVNQAQFPWTGEVKKTLKDQFHLRGFRPHQLETINATLAGKDCFVLMPTGGGKSLCYQLPAVVQSGKTRGVTVVISPLLSLMEDQVNHLRALHIQAFYINGELSYEQRRFIMNALREPQVEKFIQVLYVTPEMLSKNQAMVNLLQDLHHRQRLARIVIDEAHCVSQWGHDFRPDYKALGETRRQFIGVPVMALTATATQNVKVDTIHNLGIQGCEIFAQSFNRPNLYYEVRTKGKREDTLQKIADIIKTQYRGQSGIVYCLSRKKCEVIAQQLREKHNISAHHYHAGMESAEKSETQKSWQAGGYKVIVATIAFGMGIDKPDVRFVIHHSIPKSLEGYYQETGRAGRDGKRSGCYLFYGYQDTTILKKMIKEGEGSRQQKERQYAMLRNVVQFCENKADCRRVQVLAYFNESFRAEDCDAECDNCNSTTTFEYRDFTDLAAEAVTLVQKIQTENVTLLHCSDVFRGASSKRIKDLGHDCLEEYGAGSGLERGDAERLFQRLISEGALQEKNHVNGKGFTSQYIKLGRNFNTFKSRQERIQMHVRVSPRQHKNSKAKSATKRKGTGVAAALEYYPLSTNVSSPVQGASRTKHKTNITRRDNDDDGFLLENQAESKAEDESETYEPAPLPRSRMIAKSNKTSRQKLGPPITTDEKMARLDEVHQDVVEAFVQAGRSECQRILISRNLRAHPFTDTVLREMAISFPATPEELQEIPGIDRQMVMFYGDRFLRLIKQFKDDFDAMSGPQPDKVKDPNHEIIEISDEDEEEYGGNFDEEPEPDDAGDVRSSYFPRGEADPEVEAFNERFSQAQTSARATAGPAGGRSKRPATGIHRYNAGKKPSYRKGSRRSSTSDYSRSGDGTGVSKKTASRKREGGGTGGSTTYSKKGGQGGGGGIGMMPT
ncbi:hypothetical protein B0J12DRAFT_702930 [Macrophomina phaseolina]|uniref:DNA 3'-5' helicase n=1 Tax=Macrophomina phaseolina TaxID=35725 RepID=A0ABQ8G0F3_9PEZI|nr:hypothetical protein B0J12DRAFT_702930 [Macrophomina phaseolina]